MNNLINLHLLYAAIAKVDLRKAKEKQAYNQITGCLHGLEELTQKHPLPYKLQFSELDNFESIAKECRKLIYAIDELLDTQNLTSKETHQYENIMDGLAQAIRTGKTK